MQHTHDIFPQARNNKVDSAMDLEGNNDRNPPGIYAMAGYHDRPKKDMPCPYECDRLFTCAHNVDQHIKEVHTLQRDWACEICAREGKMWGGRPQGVFTRPGTLNRHLRTVHGLDVKSRASPRKAPVRKVIGLNAVQHAAEPTTRMTARRRHFQVNEICEYEGCGEGFLDEESALIHGHAVHGRAQAASCRCSLCQRMFGSQQQIAGPEFTSSQSVSMVSAQAVQPQRSQAPAVFDTLRRQVSEHNQPSVSMPSQPLQSAHFNAGSAQPNDFEDNMRKQLGAFLQQEEQPVPQSGSFDTSFEHSALFDFNTSKESDVELDNDVNLLFPQLNHQNR